MPTLKVNYPDVKKSIFYSLMTVILFLLFTFILKLPFSNFPSAFFTFLMCFLILGLAHVLLMFLVLTEYDKNRPVYGFILTTLLTVVGMVALILAIHYLVKPPNIGWIFSVAIFAFPIPFSIYVSFGYFENIPREEYKKWYYPSEENLPDLDAIDFSNIIVVQLELTKNTKENSRTNFKAKAPLGMALGDLFYVFIYDYNKKYPTGEIEYLNVNQQPDAWLFYAKPPLFSRRKYYDPSATFRDQQIRDNQVVIATRV